MAAIQERSVGRPGSIERSKGPEPLSTSVTSVGLHLMMGGEFTNPDVRIDSTTLSRTLADIVEGRKTVDTQPVAQLSTKERAAYQGDKSFQEAYGDWAKGMKGWIQESSSLRGVNQQLYEDRRSVLQGFAISLESFISQPREQDSQLAKLFDRMQDANGETNVEAIRDVFHASAKIGDVVSVALLERRLGAMDYFLINSCGPEAKQAVKQLVLEEGFVHASRQEKQFFLKTAPEVVNNLTQSDKKLLRDVLLEYRELKEESKLVIPPQDRTQGIRLEHPASPKVHTVMRSREPVAIIDINSGLQGRKETAVARIADIQQRPEQSVRLRKQQPDLSKLPDRSTIFPAPIKAEKGGDLRKERATGGVSVDIGGDSITFSINQDRYFASKKNKAGGVFDGVGSSQFAAEAAEAAKDTAQRKMAEIPGNMPVEKAKEKMKDILMDANQAVIRQSAFPKNHENNFWTMEQPATTGSFLKILDNNIAVIAHVGDSRIYLLREGKLHQLTLDDNGSKVKYADDESLAWMVQDYWAKKPSTVTQETRRLVGARDLFGLSKMLGDRDLIPAIYSYQLVPGDKLVLSSDGVHDNLYDSEMEGVLKNSPDNNQVAKNLLTAAAATRRKEDDDETAVVIEIQGQIPTEIPRFVPPWEKILADKEQELSVDARAFLQQFEQARQSTDRQFKFVPNELFPLYLSLQRNTACHEINGVEQPVELQNAYTALKYILAKTYSDSLAELIQVKDTQTHEQTSLAGYLQRHTDKLGEFSSEYMEFLNELIAHDMEDRPPFTYMHFKNDQVFNENQTTQSDGQRYSQNSIFSYNVSTIAKAERTMRQNKNVEVLPFLDEALVGTQNIRIEQRQVILPQ